jgi:hypothetical protein
MPTSKCYDESSQKNHHRRAFKAGGATVTAGSIITHTATSVLIGIIDVVTSVKHATC